MNKTGLRVLAEKELIEASRNRLIIGFGVVFFALALALSLLGFGDQAAQDAQVSRVGVSLLNLATLLVPLIGLVVGSQGFAGELEDGTLELVLTYPVRLSDICLGRICGQWAALASSLFVGFGASGVLLMLLSPDRQFFPFLVNLGTSLALALIFLLLGTLIAMKTRNRMTALFAALGVWFFLLILYDIMVVQVLMLTRGRTSMYFLYGLLLLNPAELLRVLAIRLTNMKELFGPSVEAMVALPGLAGPAAALSAWLAWCLAAYFLVLRSLAKRVGKKNIRMGKGK